MLSCFSISYVDIPFFSVVYKVPDAFVHIFVWFFCGPRLYGLSRGRVWCCNTAVSKDSFSQNKRGGGQGESQYPAVTQTVSISQPKDHVFRVKE